MAIKEVNKIPVAPQLMILGLLLLLIFAGTITPKIISMLKESAIPAATGESDTLFKSGEEDASDPFLNISLVGRAAYVWDITNQKAIYKKAETEQLPLASVTKLMTALVAHEVLAENENVSIDDLSIRQDGNSGLSSGEVFDRLTLSDLVLMSSSNDGAFALASAAGNVLKANSGAHSFVEAMNIRAKEIGLHETYFRNPTGLDISPTEAGAYGSARDMAFLMEYIVKHQPDILAFTKEDAARVYSKTGDFHDAENTNDYIDEIPGLIGSKTGYTDLAGGNLVVAFDAGLNRPIVAVVLGSSQDDRFTDVMELVEATQKYVQISTQ
jgi:serine-type D-Ala-D-Ala carboxypeptidase (penicillin-binding protein 5/6)